ncbi:MAG: GNAT family N-acetyltransferase [Anaerolineae bacterium]|nr:GNAT family N-acetyltransferase [Anaerolineae bacterium]
MKQSFFTRIAAPEDFPLLAAFIERQSQQPETQCIQTSTGEPAANLLAEMEQLHGDGEMLFAAAFHQDQLIGAMGCEYEKEGTRGWLRGPFAGQRWDEVAAALYTQLRQALPANITRLDTFLNQANRRGQVFYEQHGFQWIDTAHVYIAPRPAALPDPPSLACVPLEEAHHADFIALHQAIFPRTFYTGQQIIDQLDEQHRVWIVAAAGKVQGYVFAVIHPWANEGYIEFVGVTAAARGQGIGGALLTTALRYCFGERDMPQVGLTVNNDNVNARGLYERLGFQLRYTGVNHRLTW